MSFLYDYVSYLFGYTTTDTPPSVPSDHDNQDVSQSFEKIVMEPPVEQPIKESSIEIQIEPTISPKNKKSITKMLENVIANHVKIIEYNTKKEKDQVKKVFSDFINDRVNIINHKEYTNKQNNNKPYKKHKNANKKNRFNIKRQENQSQIKYDV